MDVFDRSLKQKLARDWNELNLEDLGALEYDLLAFGRNPNGWYLPMWLFHVLPDHVMLRRGGRMEPRGLIDSLDNRGGATEFQFA